MFLTLRPYQEEAVSAFFDALPDHRRQLIVLPTGSGKTVVFSAIAKRYFELSGGDKPILVMAHRTELLDQAEQKIHYIWKDAWIGRIQGGMNDQLGQVMLASTQTLVTGRRRIRQPGLIIYDECHHSRAQGAFAVLERFGVFEEDGPALLGVTATPGRSDRTQLGDVFEHITYERSILQMILDGYLADVRGVKVTVPGLQLGAIRTIAGDYNAKDLSYAMNEDEALDAVVEAVKSHATERKCIVFAVDVKHAQALAERFQLAEVASASIDGGMSPEDRANVLEAFANNKIRVIVNCQILTEGFDQPDVDCVVIARPTRSQSLYTQMVGRSLRLHPDKTDALVLDLTGASEDKSLQTFTRLMQTQRKMHDTVLSITENSPDDEKEASFHNGESVGEWMTRVTTEQQLKQDTTVQVAEAINLFANRSRYRWQRIRTKDRDAFAISFDDHRWAYLYREGSVFWPVLELNGDKFMPLHDAGVPLEYAQGIAESFLQMMGSQLIDKEAGWRDAPMSQRQQYVLDKYHLKYDSTWTCGQAADALSQIFAKGRVKKLCERFNPQSWREALEKPQVRSWLEAKLNAFRKYAEVKQTV